MEYKNLSKKIFASFLCANFMLVYTPAGVFASDITGVNPTAAAGGGNIYNIDAAKVSGSTGFRNYDKFNLDQGDIANLKFNNYTKFVNLVNNQIIINGIVNSMKGNNFYNGHAIFVSPNGMVVGASGLLNVGSLSVLTPSQSKYNTFLSKYNADNLSGYEYNADGYKGLVKDSHGNIVINGKILAREEVNLYGDNIKIQGNSDNKAGIIAGWNDSNTKFDNIDSAKIVFNNLVSNNIADTSHFALENGKIKIVSGFKDYKGEGDDREPDGFSRNAQVNIENANIGANNVEIKANTIRDAYVLANSDEAISSKIDIKDSDITGANIDILANSEDIYSRNVNATLPTIFLLLFDGDAKWGDFFQNGTYEGFEGVRTSAIVNVIHSNLKSTGDLSIKTNASSETKISSDYVSKYIPAIFYGFGTKTESKINISNESNLLADNDVVLNAISKNVLNANVSNDTPIGINIKTTDFIDLGLMKNTAIADTKITVDNSKVIANNDVSAQAIAYNEMDSRLILKTRIGQNDFASQNVGGSSVSMGAIFNATDIKSSVEIKNKSEVKADNDVTLNAYNINEVNNWVVSDILDNTNYNAEWQDGNGYFAKIAEGIDKFNKIYDHLSSVTLKDIYGKLSQKGRNIQGLLDPQNQHNVLETANFEAGFGGVWNEGKTANNVTIDNSTINAKNINIKAHTVDMTYNEADASAEEAAKWGGALSLIVNNQTNDNKVDILNSSKLNASNDIKVDSIVELPAQQGTFGISNKWFTLGVNFNLGADDEWGWDFHDPTADNVSSKIVPEGGIFGFYNNFAASAGGGGDDGKAGVSAAIIVSEINNNSDINVTNSTVGNVIEKNNPNAFANTKNVTMNSVVSTSVHDAVDFITYDKITNELKGLLKKEFNKWNASSDIAAGGAVLVQNFTNNARITVDNSTVNAVEGNAEFNSAAEQGYLSLVTPGGKAKTIGVTGAVNVQNIHGTTSSTIKNNSKINAKNITIDSGKANVQFTKKGADLAATGVEFLDDNDNVKLADKRDVKDHITAIALNGSFTLQSDTGEGNASSGAAIGATVIAQVIDTIVKSQVDNSTLTASNNINVKSESKIKNAFLTLAGAFAGGISPDRNAQNNANQGGQGANQGAQEMQNVGNWMGVMNDANPDQEDVANLNNRFNQNNPNQQGVNHAQGRAGEANQMADGVANPQGAASNFSLALAGSVNVVNNKSIVESEIINSTLNVGNELNVLADRDNFQLNITGGIAKSGSVGGGAAVNVYSDKAREITLKDENGNVIKDENGKDKTQTIASGAKAVINSSHINFISDSATKKVNVAATNNHKIINPAVGVGVAANKQSGIKAAVGGSFNANTLKDTTEAKITATEIKNDFKKDEEGKPTKNLFANDINVNTQAKAETTIWNIGGDLGFTKGNNSKFSVGAGVAGNLDMLKQTVNSEISNSTLGNVKDVIANSELKQNINSISVAGAVVTGAQSSFTIDGALGLEFIENNVTALLKDSTITSSGDIKTDAKSVITGSTSAGSLDINTAQNNVGVGIGAIINMDSSKVVAKNENVKIKKSKSVEVKADSKDKRKFVAANLGVSKGSSVSGGIGANGIISIVKTTVNALIEGNSEINSNGNIDLKSIYDNSNLEVTALLEASTRITVGANIIANYYENDVKSQISSNTIISDAKDINVSAKTNSYLNMVPVAVAISKTGGGEGLIAAAVAADIAVNIIKDKTNALAAGNITTKGNLTVAADNETTIYNRGGVVSAASSTAPASIAGVINVDYIEKTANAQIGDKNKKSTVSADGDVSVTSVSTNSIGGTPKKIEKDKQGNKADEGEYERLDITSKDYQDTLVEKNADGNYKGLKYDSNFENWNMFYDIAAGGMVSVSGTVVVKTIENTVNAEILNTNVTKSNNLKVLASDYSIKNIIAGQVAASKTAAIGAQVVVTKDESKTSALISNNSDITTTKTARVIAKNQKDNKQIDVTAEGSKNASVGVNVLVNTINDLTVAKIEDSKLSADILEVNAREDINAFRVVVAAEGSAHVAVNVNPVINYYGDDSKKQDNESDADYDKRTKGKTIAEISNSTINNAKINMNADTNTKTLDIGVGAAGAGVGFAASGLVIKNSNYTKTRALIDNNSKINTQKDITINANSTLDSNNWTVGASGMGKGFSAVVNIIINDINSEVVSKISDSTIDSAGNISLNTNKGKTDKLQNHGIAACGTGIGGAAVVALIYNTYDNIVKSEIVNSTVLKSNSIAANSYSDRDILNFDVSVGGAGLGVGAAVAAVVNNINTNTFAIIDAKDKNMKTSGLLSAVVDDNTYADNTIGFGAGGAGSAGANINLYYSENLAKAEVKSTTGQIEANSAEVKSNTTNGMKEKRVGVSAGGASIAGDVQVVRIGKAAEYTDSDKNSNIDKAEQKVADMYNSVIEEGGKKFVPGVPSGKTETGTVASVNGKLKTKNNIDIKAENILKGEKDDKNPYTTLLMSNVSVNASASSANVGVKNVKVNNNTIAEISGGQVESTEGKVSVNAKNTSKVGIDSVEVSVSGVSVAGGSEVYNNTSNTIAQIVNATVNSQTGIDVISNSVSDCVVDATHVLVKAAAVNVDLSETIDTNKSIAMISGQTNIDTKGKLNLQSIVDTNMHSERVTRAVEAVEVVNVFKNEVTVNSVSKAVMENVEGTIKANGIDMATQYSKMSAYQRTSATEITAVTIAAHETSKALMNAEFTSGIYNAQKQGDKVNYVTADKLTVVNSGETKIESAKYIGTSTTEDKNGVNPSKISVLSKAKKVDVKVGVNFFTGLFLDAKNTTKSNTFLKVKDHSAKSLTINSNLDTISKATPSSTGVTVGISVHSIGATSKNTSTLNVDIAGKNTIGNAADTGDSVGKAIINATNISKSDADLYTFDFSGLIGGGQRIRLETEVASDTIGNIGGEFNAKNTDIVFNTVRESLQEKTYGSGSLIINVSDAKATNNLKGSSILNVGNYVSGDELKNNISVKNTSTNTFKVGCGDGSGGIINVSKNYDTAEINTSTTTNIKNSTIGSDGSVVFEVANNTLLDDSGTIGGGGVIAVLDTEYNRKYISGANLNLENTEIHAKDIKLNTLSDIRSKEDKYYEYKGYSGGVVAVTHIEATNELEQKSKISLKNSKLYAKNNSTVEAKTSSRFKQNSYNDNRGFVGGPKSTLKITANYDNTLDLDSGSVISALNEAIFNFDSNNVLESDVNSRGFGFGAPAAGYSYVKLTINNELNNNGWIEAGKTVDIGYMKNSVNNLLNKVHTESTAFVANTYEDGNLEKIVNNKLAIPLGAKVISGENIEVDYTAGKGELNSSVKWETHSLWGAINDDKTTNPKSAPVNNSLNLDGEMVVGHGNSKYMKIKQDGSVDEKASYGFNPDDYSLNGGDITDGQTIKDQKLASITVKIDDAEVDLTELEDKQTAWEYEKASYESDKTFSQNTLNDFESLTNNGYSFLNSEIAQNSEISSFDQIIQNDLKSQIVGEGASKLSNDKYNSFVQAYNNEMVAINEYNMNHPDDVKAIPSVSEFLSQSTSLDLSQAQQNTIKSAYNVVQNRAGVTAKGNFRTYTSLEGVKYAAVKNPTEVEGKITCDEVKGLDARIKELDAKLSDYEARISDCNTEIDTLRNYIATLTKEKTNINNTPAYEFSGLKNSYAVTFKKMASTDSYITLDGIKNGSEFKGTGLISVSGSGLKVDNYSTRSLIFDDIDIGSGIKSGLIISGKNFSEFANKEQAVNGRYALEHVFNVTPLKFLSIELPGLFNSVNPSDYPFEKVETTGAHYLSGSNGTIQGITINNFYDTANPFAKNQNILNPTIPSDIILNGLISTNKGLNIFNDSGSIIAKSVLTKEIDGNINLVSTKGDVNLTSSGAFALNTQDSIFAGNSVNIKAESADIKGKVTAGYNKDLTLTITDDMLSNLAYDPTTNENGVLINLGDTLWTNGTNNVKALYKDNQIHLFDINDTVIGVDGSNRGKVNIVANTINNTGTINTYDGYQNINIKNQTDKQLNVYNISNVKSAGGLFKNNTKAGDAQNVLAANTQITSTGKLVLDGIILNHFNKNNQIDTSSLGSLNINANNGLEINQKTDSTGNIIDSIYASGDNNINLNGGNGNINGKINTLNALSINNSSSGSLNINGTVVNDGITLYDPQENAHAGQITMNNSGTGELNINGNIEQKGGAIQVNGNSKTKISSTAEVHNKNGNTYINSNGMNIEKDSKITNDKGNVEITNNTNDITINGDITANNGNIKIKNNGGKATIGYTETVGEDTVHIGNIVGENGDIEITNSLNGEMTIASNISHNKSNPSSSGIVSILNTPDAGNINIKSAIQSYGAGKTENGAVTAILIKNDSDTSDLNITDGLISSRLGTVEINNTKNNLNIASGAIISNTEQGNINVINEGSVANIDGEILATNGNIEIINKNEGALNLKGAIQNETGKVMITNFSDDGVKIHTTGNITNNDGYISVQNFGTGGLNIEGHITGHNDVINLVSYDSDIVIGEYASDNDNYINSINGAVSIATSKGNVLNGVSLTAPAGDYIHYDLANPNKAYKTLIAADENLNFDVKDGNIGHVSNAMNPGFSVNSDSRNYTESVNINVKGNVSASVINEVNDASSERLANIRAKESDLNVGAISVEGDILLTAADWRVANETPAPDNEEYYQGYSVKSGVQGAVYNAWGQDVSVIASNEIGSDTRPFAVMQDMSKAESDRGSISLESENDLHILTNAAEGYELKLYQVISKRGSIGIDLESDTAIKEIGANKGLNIVQKAQNLTIIDVGLGVPSNDKYSNISPISFNDMLYHHDGLGQDITATAEEQTSNIVPVIPNYINISVLDALENKERGNSNLTIYSATVKGNNGENAQYYENGTRLADVTLMADNIYANSAKAPDSTVSTKNNPNGYKQTLKSYTEADFGGVSTVAYEAKGINSVGEGKELSIDILGVDTDKVGNYVYDAQRNQYVPQSSLNTPSKFKNPNDEIKYYGTDYMAKTVSISVNDYADVQRDVVFDTLYAQDAYINTPAQNFSIVNGYITNYGEFRNKDKVGIVDNDYRRLLVGPSDIQLYTAKTGSFGLSFDKTINMKTTAPTVYNDPHKLVNGYHSEWNFLNKGQKESKDLFENKKMTQNLDKNRYNEPQKRISERFDTTKDRGLSSDYEIYDISTTGVSVKNDKKLKRGDKTTITLKFDDVDITVNAKVVNVNNDKAGLEFIDIPKDVANKILYRYMQRPGSMKSNLMTMSL